MRIVAGQGIDVVGYGSVENPYVISLEDPLGVEACNTVVRCIASHLGRGLSYQPISGLIETRISSDGGNSIVFGTDGGLYSSGGGGGGDGGYSTVQGLESSTTTIVGGSYGGGFAMHPEGDLRCYQAGMAMGLRLMHVPVRRSTEGFLFAQHWRDLGSYNPGFLGAKTDHMDLTMAERMTYLPAGPPQDPWYEPGYLPQQGYFGFAAKMGWKVPRLSEVFELSQRRTVLYLEVKDVGVGTQNGTPAPLQTYGPLRDLILQFGQTKSVIVGSEFPADSTAAEIQQIYDGLALVREAGVATAAHITSKAMLDALPPEDLVAAGFTWVFIQVGLADTYPQQVLAYKTAGLYTMLYGGHKHWHFRLTQNATLFGAGGLKGILCPDPVYCAGDVNGYRYYEQGLTLQWGTPNYGVHAYNGSIEWMRDRFRGYVQGGRAGQLTSDADVVAPGETSSIFRSGYYILQGEMCPVALPNYDRVTNTVNNYEIHIGFMWDGISVDRGRWMGLWWGAPEDRQLFEWERANQYTRGYQVQLSQEGNFVVTRYDGIPGASPPYQWAPSPPTWDSGYRPQPGIEYRMRVQVFPDRFTVARPDGGAMRTFTGADATMWRGPYCYAGKHFFNIPDAHRVRWVWPVAFPVTPTA
ncbi:hypothetical protein [Saccharothrix sp. HUAS TT1]|uniref:hypothetical protein n=1 Tax=unclassified Saccharothrix TaxID=2593673 RepID=UPI00345BAB48